MDKQTIDIIIATYLISAAILLFLTLPKAR